MVYDVEFGLRLEFAESLFFTTVFSFIFRCESKAADQISALLVVKGNRICGILLNDW